MPYPPKFILDCSADRLEMRYLIESIAIGADSGPFEGSLRLASFTVDGYTDAILREQSSISYGSLRPGSWSRSYGGIRIGIAPTTDVRPYTAPGQCIQLRVGLEGYEIDEFVPVWLGVVRNLIWRSDMWVLEAVELTAALTNRFTSDSDKVLLFSDLTSTTLNGNFAPNTDADFNVAAGAGIQRSSESGDRYCLLITPTDGDPFFTLADTKSAANFSDLTAYPGPILGTFPTDASDGDAVQECAYTETHPLRVALRVLTSSGTAGQNGEHDVLPELWGYGIQAQYIDFSDTEYFRGRLAPTTGTTQWQMVVTEAQEDGLSWISEWLRPGGFFLCLRQGLLTARGVRSPYYDKTAVYAAFITDDHIKPGSVEYHTWDPDSPIEYSQSVVDPPQYYLSQAVFNTSGSIESRPVRSAYYRQLVSAYADFDPIGTSRWGDEVAERLGPFDVRRPERLSLQTAGLGFCGVTLGDLVSVDSSIVPTARSRDDDPIRRFLVIGGGPDWFQGYCSFELLTHPSEEVET